MGIYLFIWKPRATMERSCTDYQTLGVQPAKRPLWSSDLGVTA